MKYFTDTEFAEDGKTIELISIGIVSEDRRELYLVNKDFDINRCNPWVLKNVIPKLPERTTTDVFGREIWVTREVIAERVAAFVAAAPTPPEFWAYYGAYDWIAICQLFGTMMGLPNGWPMFVLDLKQYAYHLGLASAQKSLQDFVPQGEGAHDALEDAKWNRRVYDYLLAHERTMRGM